MSLSGAVTQLQTLALTISGIKDAPVNPPESINVFPFVVAYPARGTFTGEGSGTIRGLHTIYTEVHYARTLLGAAVNSATAMVETYADKILANPTLAGTVDTILMSADGQPFTYEFGRLEWGGLETIGIRFAITVKIRRSI